VNFDLYRLLYRPELYEVAYQRIKSKPGNMTAGSDGSTLDGFSYQAITDLIGSIRDESFQFKPARRTFIPKANGKMRPLGISSPRDKVVQEVLRLILEAIYDSPRGAYFLDCSHGFRPNRSCHTALREFSSQWTGMTWIIEGDIKSCFDEIDHHTLVGLLRKKIADGRFLNLIWKALRAGYLWGKERRDTLTGSPQGSIISPILANVYLTSWTASSSSSGPGTRRARDAVTTQNTGGYSYNAVTGWTRRTGSSRRTSRISLSGCDLYPRKIPKIRTMFGSGTSATRMTGSSG